MPPDDRPVTLRRISVACACERLDELLVLYAAAFAGPPWHAEQFPLDSRRAALTEQFGHPGGEVLVAERDGTLAGAAWGWAPGVAPPDDELHRRVRAAADADAAGYLTGGAFALLELMVDPAAQGQGIGTRLLAEITGDRPAWLLTHTSGAGLALYAGTGWRAAGQFALSNGTPLQLMVRPGRPRRHAPA